jgi:hypothetical protein
MPNEVTIKIKVKDESDFEPTLVKAREFGAKLKEELEKAGRQAGSDAADEIKRQLEELNPPNIDVNVETEKAKEEIHEVKDDLDRLDGDGVDIDVHLHDEAAKVEAKVLKEKLKHELGDSGGAGTGWAKSFQSSLQNFDFKPGLLSVGIGVGAAFAPLIGASIAAAVVGGLGLGGIVGGVFIAAKDPRVQSAFSEMKSDLGEALKLDAAPFVPVVEEGIKSIQSEFHSIDLKGIFADLAPQVRPVLNGILDLIGSLGEALRNVAANSGPVLKELGTDFRNLGNTLEAAFNSLTDNGEQEAQALHDLFATLDGAITVTFDLVNALTELYGAFHALLGLGLIGFYEQMQDHSQKVTGAIKQQVSGAIAAAEANGELGDSAKNSAAASKLQAEAITSVADALKASTDPAFALVDAQKQVNSAQSAYNKAVKSGGENSKGAKSASEALQKALINYVGAAGKARDGTGHLTSEQKALLKTAGASDGVIKGLDKTLQGAYKSAKKLDGFDINVDYNIDVYARVHGTNATAALQHDKDLNKLYGLAHGGVSGAANGSTSSGLTWVGERGAELLDLPPGTSVRTHGDSKRDAAAWGVAAGGAAVTVAFDKAGLSGLAAALVETIRAEVRYQGGNVQQVLGQPGR